MSVTVTLREPCVASLRTDRHQIGMTDRHHRNAHPGSQPELQIDLSRLGDSQCEGILIRTGETLQLNARLSFTPASLPKIRKGKASPSPLNSSCYAPTPSRMDWWLARSSWMWRRPNRPAARALASWSS